MANRYLFKTTAEDLLNDVNQIQTGLITGDRLNASVNLPVGTLLDGTLLTTRITAAAGGYDFHASVKTVVRVLDTDKGIGWDYDTLTHQATLASGTYDLSIAGNQNCQVPLVDGDRVALMVVSGSIASGSPAADQSTGIYTIAYVSGDWVLTRATDADGNNNNFTIGALTFLEYGVSPIQAGQGLVLIGGEYEYVTAVWAIVGAAFPVATGADEVLISTGPGTSYTTKQAGDLVADVLAAGLGGDPAGTTFISNGAGDITTTSTTVAALLAATDQAGARSAIGAGTSNYADPLTTNGDLLVRAGGVTTRLPVGASPNSYVLNLVAGAPAWAQVSLTAGVTGVLPIANGGLGSATPPFTSVIDAVEHTTNNGSTYHLLTISCATGSRAYTFRGTVSAAKSDYSNAYAWDIIATVSHDGAVTLRGAVITPTDPSGPYTVSCDINGSNLRVAVNGVAATDVKWHGGGFLTVYGA